MIMRKNSLSKYEQFKNAFCKDMIKWNLTAGDRIPTEPELVEKYNVGRNIIREAISSLVHEGLLVKQQGSGTFITEQSIASITSNGNSNAIALCYHFVEYNRGLVRNCQEYLLERDSFLIQFDILEDDQDPEKERQFLLKAEKEHFKGVIITPTPFEPTNHDLYKRLREQGIKVVMLESYKTDMSNEVCFMPDYRHIGYMLTAKMAVAGCKQVVLASRYKFPIAFQKMKAGLMDAARELDMTVLDDMIFQPWVEDYKDACNTYPEILSEIKKLPVDTGILATQRGVAHAIYEIAEEANRRIPDDLKLCAEYSHTLPESPDISYVISSREKIMKDIIDYIMDDSISPTKLFHKLYNFNYENKGSL